MNRVPAILFGVPIDSYTMSETINRLAELVELGRSRSRTHQVATVNVDFLVNALADPGIMTLLQQAELNLADGMPLVWASRLLGRQLPERVAGADLVPLLAQASEQHGWRVHLFGAAPGVAERARSMLGDRYPGSTITADAGPSINDLDHLDAAIIASIRAADPDVLCVALGNPKQERFIAAYRDALGCPVMIGIGGSLDMLVGDKKRAPKLAQQIGAEWLFRAAQEPGRLGRRYAHDLRILGPQALSYWNSVRRYRSERPLTVDVVDNRVVVCASRSTPVAAFAIEEIDAVALDFGGISAIPPESHALIVGLLRDARLRGVPMTLTGISPRLQVCLHTYGTWPMLAPMSAP